jgi:hypothetical protein
VGLGSAFAMFIASSLAVTSTLRGAYFNVSMFTHRLLGLRAARMSGHAVFDFGYYVLRIMFDLNFAYRPFYLFGTPNGP